MFDSAKKIVDWSEAQNQVSAIQKQNGKVVFTNGCFDLVHAGHVDYLEKARNLGDLLVVGLNTDASISAIKGANRPVAVEESRSRVLAAFGFVDLVVLFGEPTPLELIHLLKPDILTKGDDYTVETIVGSDFVLSYQGMVATIPLVKGFSTSAFIHKIISTS
jgi:rfaE bifunctional protein nucleotidyltransferase chain/domain